MQIFKIVYNIFLGFIAIIAALLIVSIFPITGNYKLLIVQSGSMEPELKIGSMVITKPVDKYEIGDVVTFNYDNTLITHRIFETQVERGKQVFVTKGDANNAADKNKVFAQQIIGKVFFDIPYIGYIIDTTKKPIGFVLIIVLPALLVIADEVKNIVTEVRKRNKGVKE